MINLTWAALLVRGSTPVPDVHLIVPPIRDNCISPLAIVNFVFTGSTLPPFMNHGNACAVEHMPMHTKLIVPTTSAIALIRVIRNLLMLPDRRTGFYGQTLARQPLEAREFK